MHTDRNVPARAPFLQTPDALIDDVSLTDSALRLLQAMVKLAPRNGRNSDAVAKSVGMGKEKTNAARKLLRACGHWHARKRHNVRGEIRDQRLASLTPLRTEDEVAAGWAAAEEAARLGKDTASSRRLGVRILNSVEWVGSPAAGAPAARLARRRSPDGDQRTRLHTPHPLPKPAPQTDHSPPPPPPPPRNAEAPAPAPAPAPELPPLTGRLASYADRAERVLLHLRRTHPQLALPVADARELARIAGHYLLREESPETIRAVVAQGLPPEGVRCPKAFVRQRLLRYLPPLPDWPHAPAPVPAPASSSPVPSDQPASPPAQPVVRPNGPVDLVRRGQGWRAAFQAAADGVPLQGSE